MSIITLTTDWNQQDYYSGMIKGTILSQLPDAQIIDISHQIQAHNYSQAAFVLAHSYPSFPAGTIHIVDVNSDCSSSRPPILLAIDGQYIIGTDNGLFALLLVNRSDYKAYRLALPTARHSFVALTVFAKAAVAIAQAAEPSQLGEPYNKFVRSTPLIPIVESNSISGHVIHIDSYGNVISNITQQLFDELCAGRSYIITLQSRSNKVSRISENYQQVDSGELLALFNTIGLLEMAVSMGDAAELFGLSKSSTIRIRFL